MNEHEVKILLEKNNLKWEDFKKWMIGQTVTADESGNTIYFTHDVRRYVLLMTEGTPTYWD